MVKNTNRVGTAIAMILRVLLNTKAWFMFNILITKGSAPMESIIAISWGTITNTSIAIPIIQCKSVSYYVRETEVLNSYVCIPSILNIPSLNQTSWD